MKETVKNAMDYIKPFMKGCWEGYKATAITTIIVMTAASIITGKKWNLTDAENINKD